MQRVIVNIDHSEYLILLQAMESKLLIGGKSIVDKTSEQERALEERRKQLADQKVCLPCCVLYFCFVVSPLQ